MTTSSIAKLSDDELLARVRRTYHRGRKCAAQLIRLLIEVEERRLHLTTAHPSMFEFCIREFGMSRSSAQRYSTAARLSVEFPELVQLVERGELHMSTLVSLRYYVTKENVSDLIALSRGRSRYEVEELLLDHAPRPDAPSRMRKIPTPRNGRGVRKIDRPIQPLGDARYRVEFNASRRGRDNIKHVLDLMRHANPSGDLDVAMEYCIDAGLERLQSRRLGVVRTRPARKDRDRMPSTRARGVPQAVRRAVFERDGEQCTFRDEKGRRCPCTTFLELDHVELRSDGGLPTVENLRVRCRPHNALYAEQVLGKEFMAERIRARKSKQAERAAATTMTKGIVKAKPSTRSGTAGRPKSHATGERARHKNGSATHEHT